MTNANCLHTVLNEYGDLTRVHSPNLCRRIQRSRNFATRTQNKLGWLDNRQTLPLAWPRPNRIDIGFAHPVTNWERKPPIRNGLARTSFGIGAGGNHLDAESVQQLELVLHRGQLPQTVPSPHAPVEQNVRPRIAKITRQRNRLATGQRQLEIRELVAGHQLGHIEIFSCELM